MMTQIIRNMDRETPLSIEGSTVRVDWYRAGEGFYGDYDPLDPEDKELLRFDVYQRDNEESEWYAVEDASYCTSNEVTTSEDVLIRKLRFLYEEYANALRAGGSVKKMGEALSWI